MKTLKYNFIKNSNRFETPCPYIKKVKIGSAYCKRKCIYFVSINHEVKEICCMGGDDE